MEQDRMKLRDAVDATVTRGTTESEVICLKGRYDVECIGPDGEVKWRDYADNIVPTQGKDYILNLCLQNSGTGTPFSAPFLGLISSVGYSGAPVGIDTMASHPSWNEAGNGVNFPNWSTPASNARGTTAWAASSSGTKALSAVIPFIIAINAGTVKGCFMVGGTLTGAAVATNANTNGILISAGLFSNGDKVVGIGDTLNVSYSLALT